MTDLLKIAENLAAAGLDHPAVDDAVIKLTNGAKGEPVAWVNGDDLVSDEQVKWYAKNYPRTPGMYANYTLLYTHPAGGVVDEALEWLDTEVSGTSTRYHGDPSYDHDAYWMKEKVIGLIRECRTIFAAQAAAQPAVPSVPEGSEWWRPDARVIELAERLVAPGPKASHVSASETHEISEFILGLAATPKDQPAQGVDGE